MIYYFLDFLDLDFLDLDFLDLDFLAFLDLRLTSGFHEAFPRSF